LVPPFDTHGLLETGYNSRTIGCVEAWGLPPVLTRSKRVANPREGTVAKFLNTLWQDEQGQDIAEYAVMLAVILVIVVGTIRLIGSNANNVFSSVGSAIQ
jgi:Flp pilus assembly pilin Flp